MTSYNVRQDTHCSMQTATITYVKTFTSGTLTGLAVPVSISGDAVRLAAWKQKVTQPGYVGRDVLTGTSFTVSAVTLTLVAGGAA